MLRWGLVGAGAISNKRVGPALVSANNSQLVAVCDVDQAAARDFAGRFAVEHLWAEFDQLLQDDAVDAVYLATPIYLHAPQAIRALQAGKHVLVEKPMALTVAEAEEMNRTAGQTGKTLATAYYRRFFPKVQRAEATDRRGRPRDSGRGLLDLPYMVRSRARRAGKLAGPQGAGWRRCAVGHGLPPL